MKRFAMLLFAVACVAAATAPPRVTVGIVAVGDSLRFTTSYQLPVVDLAGPIDSARITIAGTLVPLVKKLAAPLIGTDVSHRDGPPPGVGYNGTVCITVFRRLKTAQTCAPWSYSRADVAPAPPALQVTVDTLP